VIFPQAKSEEQAHRWALVPDADSKMHLVDLNPIEQPIEPSFVAETDVVFLLFTRTNPTVAQRLVFNDVASVRNSNFNANHPSRFTVHGWNGAPSNPVNVRSNEEYFRLGDFNVRKLLIYF
jgi:pancreatic triacylglycerol lipase